MNKPRISAIAAMSENNVIGRDNDLPWHISADLKRVKALTAGHVLIMGRKTYESIGKPLPNRITIIVTRDNTYSVEGTFVAHSIEEAIKIGVEKDSEEIFIFGGGQIYKEAMPYIERLYLTLVHTTITGDAYFPDYSEFKKVVAKEEHEENGLTFSFLTLDR
jgi:dihydrofolate reductase